MLRNSYGGELITKGLDGKIRSKDTIIGALKIIKKYLKRWKIEEYLQFIKTNFGMEKFRIRKYKSIKLLIF